MDSWLNMVLLCGLLLIASLQTTKAFRFRRSKSDKIQMLSTKLHYLQAHYNTKDTEWFGKSVFLTHLDQLNSKDSCNCQALLLERMLKTYEDIFQDMLKKLNKTDEKEVKASLTYVMNEVKELRHSSYKEEHKVWRELQDIDSLKVKNLTIQKGALNNFLMVFHRAEREKEAEDAR